ncbi:hypothetical protein HPB50_019831 [Hyalomma asiaticum]|uniref:Uncharacterized protein n=1 Tax=Hyalomma asiaticum TaxID=266040 RepID=A0ACB7SCH9_HYAAI|nr:hypothetical protein HPB50_019831 [Hyalomma asiaticum]
MVVPGTSSSPSPVQDSQESSGSRPRSLWTEAETWVLLPLWEDHLPQLRGEKHNARVYDAIVATLAESGILRTRRQIISSIESNTSESAEDITEDAPSDSQEPTASKPQQQRRPQKRKRTTVAETFRSTLLEQQGRLISALQQAAKDDQALRERQVNAQENLVDLSQYFSK